MLISEVSKATNLTKKANEKLLSEYPKLSVPMVPNNY